MRSVSLLKVHRSIKATPFPFADVHDDGELEYQKTLTWEKKDILTITSASYYYLHFSF